MKVQKNLQTPARGLHGAGLPVAEGAPPVTPNKKREGDGMTTPDALRQVLQQARELKEYVVYYLSARADRAKLGVRNALLWTVLGVLGCVALSGVFITASWFVLSGVAGGLSVLFGDRLWIGNIVTGFLAAAGVGLGVWYVVATRINASLKRTVHKYEERKARQRKEFGRSICDQAARVASANE